MKLAKPKIQRVYVTATDPETRKSDHLTVYGANREQVIEQLRKLAGESDAKSSRRRRAS